MSISFASVSLQTHTQSEVSKLTSWADRRQTRAARTAQPAARGGGLPFSECRGCGPTPARVAEESQKREEPAHDDFAEVHKPLKEPQQKARPDEDDEDQGERGDNRRDEAAYGAQYFPLSRDPRWPFDRSVIPGCRHGSLQRSGCELVGGADGCGIHLVVGEDDPDAMVAIASVCLSP